MTNPVTLLYPWSHFLCHFDWHTYLIIYFTAFIFYNLLYPLFFSSPINTQLVMSTSCAQCLVVVRNHKNFELEQLTIFDLLFVWKYFLLIFFLQWFKNVNWIVSCSVTGLTAVAMDVAVPRTNIREDARGNPVLSFYVQFSSSIFLSAGTLATAVKVGILRNVSYANLTLTYF